MADINYDRFQDRLRQIEQAHSRSSAYVRLEERNGIYVPVERVRVGRHKLPMRGLVFALVAFLLFKGYLLASLGELTYVDRVTRLEEGSIVEQLGAWAMRADTVTHWLAVQIKPLF